MKKSTLTHTMERVARCLATEPNLSKVEVADRYGIVPRTLYFWLKREDFLSKIKEYESQLDSLPVTSVEDVWDRLSEAQKKQLREKIISVERKKGTYFPELDKVEDAIINLEDFEAKEKALSSLELLIGRIKYSLHDQSYNENGQLKEDLNRFEEIIDHFRVKLSLALSQNIFDEEISRRIQELREKIDEVVRLLRNIKELDPRFERNVVDLLLEKRRKNVHSEREENIPSRP